MVSHVGTLIEPEPKDFNIEQDTPPKEQKEAGLYWHLQLCKRVFERLRKEGYFREKPGNDIDLPEAA